MAIRPTATVVVARAADASTAGIAVLVLRRSRAGPFAPGFVVVERPAAPAVADARRPA